MKVNVLDFYIYPKLTSEMHVNLINVCEHFGVSLGCLKDISIVRPSLRQSAYRKSVMRFFDNQCFICGYKYFLELHHIKHQEHGGADSPDNLVPLCPNHHREWHYYENTFVNRVASGDDDFRANAVLGMDWQIPEFVMSLGIAPVYIQIAKLSEGVTINE